MSSSVQPPQAASIAKPQPASSSCAGDAGAPPSSPPSSSGPANAASAATAAPTSNSNNTTTNTVASTAAGGGSGPSSDAQHSAALAASAGTATSTPATAAATAADTAANWVPQHIDLDAASRPVVALSQQLMPLLKQINNRFCKQQRLKGGSTKFNNGYDDKEGHYIVLAGEEILNRYTVQELLGKGSFGTVLKCFDEKRQEIVAMKITRNGTNFRNQAKLEIDILLKLNNNPNVANLVVRLLKVFDWQGHLVLVFELLSFNLYQLIKCTRFNGVSLDLVRKFAYQLVQVLQQLEQHNPPIIHCDLKPENILLKNQNRSGIRLIDFGSACYETRRVFKYIQSRFYRSPEVILGLPYGTAIDRWSMGTVLVELHTGAPVFNGQTEAHQLQRFYATLGPIPESMVRQSTKFSSFFTEGSDGSPKLLMPPEPRQHKSLRAIIGVDGGKGPQGRREGQPGHTQEVYEKFHDFIERLLQYDPAKRLTLAEALQHPFLEPLTVTAAQPPPAATATAAAAPDHTAAARSAAQA